MGFPIQKKSFAAKLAAVVMLAGMVTAAVAQQPVVAAPGTAPMAPKASAPLEAYTGPTYDNRWEVFAGLLYMNGQAGQDLPDRYNLGGGEVMGTYWLGNAKVKKLGVVADYRIAAGTSQTAPIGATIGLNRILVYQNIFSGGAEYRGPKNRYAAVNFHALAGGSYGVFDHALVNYPGYPASAPTIVACPDQLTGNSTDSHKFSLGMYCNHVAPWAAAGGSIDFNDSAKLAFRLSPEITFEHFGTETREFFSISMGAMYRFGKTKK